MSISSNETSEIAARILVKLRAGERTLTQLYDAMRPLTLAEVGRALFELSESDRVVGVFRVTGPDGVSIGDYSRWSDVPEEGTSNGETFRIGPSHVEVWWSRRDEGARA